MVPPALLRARQLGREVVVVGTQANRDLGSRRLACADQEVMGSAGMLSERLLQPNTTDHVPVLADEVRALLALEPGHTLVDATFGAGGHASLLVRDLRRRQR
jgi:hypothetical protein